MKTIANLLAKLTGPVDPTAPVPPRAHDCSRCSKLRDDIAGMVPDWQVPQCESFVGPGGVIYWTGLCKSCHERETEERIQIAVAQGMARDVAEKKYGINKGLLEKRRKEREEHRKLARQIQREESPPALTAEEYEQRRAEQLDAARAWGADAEAPAEGVGT